MTPTPHATALTIGGAARALGTTIDTIRYYEKEGISPPPARGPDGRRRYDETAIAWLSGVVMLRGTGMNVQQMKQYAAAYQRGATEQERLALLEDHRATVVAQMAEVERHLAALDTKIARYRQLVSGALP